MKFSPYLMFNGNCAEAFAFYAQTLGAKIVRQLRYKQAPAGVPMPPNCDPEKIMHVCLEKDGFRLMGGDMNSDCGAALATSPFTVSISVDSVDEAKRLTMAMSEGGQMFMPPGETFFSQQFAMFSDRFGMRWMVDCARAEREMPK